MILKISSSNLTRLNQICVNSVMEECGIFLGVIRNKKIIISDVIYEKNNPIRKYNSTIRHTLNVFPEYQRRINENLIVDYIGEWHTHPSGDSTPSFRDRRTIKKILYDPMYGKPEKLVLCIISKEDGTIFYLSTRKKFKKIKFDCFV